MLQELRKNSLREKIEKNPAFGVILVRIFLLSDWIGRDSIRMREKTD